MKLLLAIVRNDCAGDVVSALNEQGFRVTRISTTGGFWRRGNVTLLVGVEDEKVDEALKIIDANSGPTIEPETATGVHPPHRATVFVVGVNSFEHY
jgi:uncharacterized protein YaaQ